MSAEQSAAERRVQLGAAAILSPSAAAQLLRRRDRRGRGGAAHDGEARAGWVWRVTIERVRG
jgi:hypothetical protein